jgi:uroporphyrin-III C-methyltransferase
MTGRVYLVGAGPGDPELLTVKALRLLRQADVVLHDELVSPEILKLARVNAHVRNVGKRCGVKNICQEEINASLVGYASAGRVVVRLKGGDPMIFGRADEEIAALRTAGIQFEVVPGITAGLGASAAAQVPLTQRCLAPAVIFITYHRAGSQPAIDWRSLAAGGATIVLYMPGRDHASISRDLRAAGLGGQTPCVIVSRATTPDESLLATTLEQLAEAPPLPAPALLIIGAAVRSAALRSQDSETAAVFAGHNG